MKYFGLFALIGIMLMSCAHQESKESSVKSEAKAVENGGELHKSEPWFQGSIEEAFLKANAEKKLVFLYWGAVWCPPCNELKSEVFSKAQFAGLMQNFVTVYLDGDTENAQTWGEKLHASGYPTILILDAKTKELARLNTVISIDEFAELIATVKDGQSFTESLARALDKTRPANQKDYQLLANVDWEQLPEDEWPETKKKASLQQLTESVPEAMVRERAQLLAQLLTLNFEASGKDKNYRKQHKAEINKLSTALKKDILEKPEAVWAVRSFINNKAEDFAQWITVKHPQYQSIKNLWLKAAEDISNHQGVSVDTRLWTCYPELGFINAEAKKPDDVMGPKIDKAVRQADADARTDFERHAVISGAAFLLRQIGSISSARDLLIAEAERSNTPWYYYGSLSALEAEQKNKEASAKWSAKARETVQGRASKIQWISSDLTLNAKYKNSIENQYLQSIVRQYYDLVFELKDGFEGRNRTRMDRVQNSLQDWKNRGAFQEIFAHYRGRCGQLAEESKLYCEKHFAALL